MQYGRKLFIMAAAVLALVSCATRQTPAEALLDRLEALVEDGKIMYGHQDDLLYGNSWKLAQDATQFNRSDVYSDRKSTRLNSSHKSLSRMPSSA